MLMVMLLKETNWLKKNKVSISTPYFLVNNVYILMNICSSGYEHMFIGQRTYVPRLTNICSQKRASFLRLFWVEGGTRL